jgi:hypothetical protein
MRRVASKRFIHGVLPLGAIAFIASPSIASIPPSQADNQSKPSALSLKIDESPLQPDQNLKTSYAPIVQRVAPSVVKVFVTSSIPETQLSLPHLDSFATSLTRASSIQAIHRTSLNTL